MQNSWKQLSDYNIFIGKIELSRILNKGGLKIEYMMNKYIPKYHLIEKVFTHNIAKTINDHYGEQLFKTKEDKVNDLIKNLK